MHKELQAIKGIGPATARLLEAHGFRSCADLATARLDSLAALPGFGMLRGAQLIAAARALSVSATERAAVATGKTKQQIVPENGGPESPSDHGKPKKKKRNNQRANKDDGRGKRGKKGWKGKKDKKNKKVKKAKKAKKAKKGKKGKKA